MSLQSLLLHTDPILPNKQPINAKMQNLHGTACCKTIFEPAASYRQLHSYLTVSHQESYLELKTSAISAEMNPKYLTFSEANKAEPRCTEQSTDSCNITSGLSTFPELANTTDLALKSIEDCITSFDPLTTELSVQTSKGVPPMESILSPIRTSKMSILEALWMECATAPKLLSATPKQKPKGKSSLPWRGKDHRLEPFKDMVHESANKKELFASLHSLRICTDLCLDSVCSMDGPNSSNSISSLELWFGVQPFNCSLPSAADTAQLSGDQVTDNAGTDPSDVETWVSDDLAIARFEKDRKSRLEKQSALQLLALNENKCMRSDTLAKREDKNDKVKLPSVLCCPNVAVRNYESSKINSGSRGMAKEPPSCSSSSFSVDCLRSDQSDLNINDSSLVRHSEYLNFDNLEHSSEDPWGFLDSEAENLSFAGNSDYDDSSAGSPLEENMEWVFGADAIEMFDNDARFMFPGKDCSDNLSPGSEHLSEIHDSGSICMSDQESRESRLFTERSHIMTGESLKLELGNFFGNQELVESPRLGCNRWSADLKYVKAEIEAATLPKTTENMLEALPEYLTPRGIVNDNHVGKGVENSLHVALGHDFIPTSSTFMLCNGHGNFYLFNKGNSTLHLCINVEGSNVSLPELFSDSDGTYGSDRQHYIVAECFQLVLPETMILLPSCASIVLEPGSRIQIQLRAGPQWGQEQEQAKAARNSILSGVITIREACMNERSEMSLLESVPVSIFQTQRTDILLNGISPPLRDLSKECILSPGNRSMPLCFENHGKHKAVVFVSIDSEASPRQFVLQHGERQAVSLNISKQKQFVQIIYMELDCWKVQMATLNYFAELFNTLKCDQNGSQKERLARLFVSCHRAMTKVKTYYFAGILSSGEGGHPGTLKFLNDKLLTPNLSGVEHAYEPDKLNYLPKTPQSQNSKYSGLESNHTSDFIHWLLKVLVSCSGLQEETERLCQKVHLSSTESDSYFMSSSKFHVRSLQLTNEIGNILVENFLKFVASDRKEIAKRAPAMDWFFQTKFRCSTPAKPLHITTDTAPSNDIYSSEHEDPNPSSRSRRSLAISRLSLDSKAFSEAQSSNEVDVDFLVLDDSWKGVGTRGSVNRQQDPIIQEPCWVLNNASAGIKEQRKIVYEHLQANASNIKRLNAQENIESSKTPRKRIVDELIFDRYENRARLISNDNEDNESDCNLTWAPRTPQSMEHEQGNPSFEETVVDELVFDSYENHARLISNDNEDNESDFNSPWAPRTPQSTKHEQGNPSFEETVVDELVFDSYENHARLISNDNEDNESDFNSPWAPRTPQSMKHEQGNPGFEETVVDELVFDSYENHARLISNDNEDNESDFNSPWTPRTPQSMKHEQGDPSFEETVVDELVFDSYENHARLISNDNEDNESDFNSTWTPRTPQSMKHEQGNPGFEETVVNELVFDSYENHARLISNDNEDNESDFNSPWAPRTPQSMEHEQGNPSFEETGDVLPSSDTTPKFYEEDQNYIEELANTSAQYGGKAVSNFGLLKSPQVNMYKPYHRRVCPKSSLEQHSEHARPAAPVVLSKISLQTSTKLSKGMVLFQRSIDHIVVSSTLADGLEKSNELQSRASFGRPKKESFACAKTPGYAENVDPGQRTELFGSHLQRQSSGEFSQSVDNVKMVSSYRDLYIAIKNAGKFLYDEGLSVHHLARARDYSMKANNIASSA